MEDDDLSKVYVGLILRMPLGTVPELEERLKELRGTEIVFVRKSVNYLRVSEDK